MYVQGKDRTISYIYYILIMYSKKKQTHFESKVVTKNINIFYCKIQFS